uniref:Uncharacterized protein n=1 Tax=Anguilla anguilla TaxID=7936 RepID=A0A0E9WQ38_ANGAN
MICVSEEKSLFTDCILLLESLKLYCTVLHSKMSSVNSTPAESTLAVVYSNSVRVYLTLNILLCG